MASGTICPSRHEQRIARIYALSQALSRPVSREYLHSCDVRALPVLLEQLEALGRGDSRERRWPFGRRPDGGAGF